MGELMIDLLFGWLTKPNYLMTGFDRVIGFIELLIVVFVLAIIHVILDDKHR